MDSISQRARGTVRERARDDSGREVAFYVRAKTGPRSKDWSPVGVAMPRKNGQPGFTIKLNTLPISKDWDGGLVLVPPFEADGDQQSDD